MLQPRKIPLIIVLVAMGMGVLAEIEYNTVNSDGSFKFRHSNDDIGGFYHSASGGPDKIVRGRYGSRNPMTGQVEETVYTAGPRGFRVNGPKIHRKMDLAQFPVLPRGTPDDPLADPYDVPTYSFNYRTNDQSRSENTDATGRTRGLFSFIDDVGERHSVRYAAGAGTGFEVWNAVPDNPSSVGYSSPLYKAHPKTRGKMTVQRGPNGAYKLIAAGPDHRRAESRGTDGVVRGTYSYLDDKGVQRTVEYIAGAGIGYRVLKNQIGPGTHVNPSVNDLRLTDTNFKLTNEFGPIPPPETDYLKASGSGSRATGSDSGGGGGGSGSGNAGAQETGTGTGKSRIKSDRMGTASGSNRGGMRFRGGDMTKTNNRGNAATHDGDLLPNSARQGGRRVNGGAAAAAAAGAGAGTRGGGGGGRQKDATGQRAGGNTLTESLHSVATTSANDGDGDGDEYEYDENPSSNNYNFNDDDVGSLPPLITANRKILEVERERDWVQRQRDSTLIKNVGKWYIGLPPGQSVRAHVQNIDLLPVGGRRVPSPSEALRQDELAEMVASLEHVEDSS